MTVFVLTVSNLIVVFVPADDNAPISSNAMAMDLENAFLVAVMGKVNSLMEPISFVFPKVNNPRCLPFESGAPSGLK